MFTSFLKDEINTLKRKREETLATLGEEQRQSKYIRTSELERKREEEYKRDTEERVRNRVEKEAKKLENLKSLLEAERERNTEVVPSLPVDEVKRRLKARSQPITMFGESDEARADRLRELEISNPLDYNQIQDNHASFDGSDFLRRVQEEEYDEDIEVQKRKQEEKEDPDFKIEDREPNCAEEEILFFFRKVLLDMGSKLEKRSETEKKSRKGREDTAIYGQTKEYLRPFFAKLRERAAPKVIVEKMHEIVTCLLSMAFVKANDAYYRMAIGNSPWPMGVTMVGIHERSAREKISTSETAHILNDEVQRKYISSVKRLMTFWQDQHPQLPSKTAC